MISDLYTTALARILSGDAFRSDLRGGLANTDFARKKMFPLVKWRDLFTACAFPTPENSNKTESAFYLSRFFAIIPADNA